jgi:hypothetical protein
MPVLRELADDDHRATLLHDQPSRQRSEAAAFTN